MAPCSTETRTRWPGIPLRLEVAARDRSRSALYYSLVESAKLTGIDPGTYIEEAVRRAIANPGTATLPRDLI